MRVLFAGIGLTHYFNQVLNRLQRDLGIEICNVVAAQGPGHAGEGVLQSREGVEFQVAPLEQLSLPFHYSSFKGLPRLLREVRPRIAVVSGELLTAFALDPLLRLSLAQTGCKVILKSIPFQVPGYAQARARSRGSPLRRALLELRALTYRIADAHALYVDEGRAIYQGYGVPAERLFVTRNSPDTDRLFAVRARLEEKDRLPEPPNRLVHVGRLVQWKRVDLLIEALALLHERALPGAAPPRLLVVGEGPERPALERHAAARGVADAVEFAGGVYEPEQLGRLLLGSSVYVLAGMGGLSINDAMCFGLPVVCSVCDGTEKALVREGENGAYFEQGSASSLAAAIANVLSDPLRRRAMGARSSQIIRDEVNIQTVVDGYRRAFAFVEARR